MKSPSVNWWLQEAAVRVLTLSDRDHGMRMLMRRFDGQDQRLDRLLQTSLMLMESLEGFEHK